MHYLSLSTVRMAMRDTENGVDVDTDVRLPEHVGETSLIAPSGAAALQSSFNFTSTAADSNYYKECVDYTFVDGYSLFDVGPAAMTLTRVNGTFELEGGGWFNAAPLAGAVATYAADPTDSVYERSSSGYHFVMSQPKVGYNYNKGGDAGVAAAFLITSTRGFNKYCRARTLTDAEATALRAVMNSAGDAEFKDWTSSGVSDGSRFEKAAWDDGGAPLSYTVADMRASLMAAAPDDVKAVLSKIGDAKLSVFEGGLSGTFGGQGPPRQLDFFQSQATVLAMRVAWPGVDADAFQPMAQGSAGKAAADKAAAELAAAEKAAADKAAADKLKLKSKGGATDPGSHSSGTLILVGVVAAVAGLVAGVIAGYGRRGKRAMATEYALDGY
jgi:hypothetical protein